MIRNVQLLGYAEGDGDVLDDLGGEARAVVRLDRGQSKPWDNVVKEEVSYCIRCFSCRGVGFNPT